MLIVFEGLDGGGKTTQVHVLSHKLREAGLDPIVTREPGGTELSEACRRLLKEYDLSPISELFLFLAGRNEHLKQKILPALASNRIVLCDRFVDSTYVYQGYCKGVSIDLIDHLHEIINCPKPDLVVFFPYTYRPEVQDRLEVIDSLKIREGFRKRFDSRWIEVPDASQETVTEFIWNRISRFL